MCTIPTACSQVTQPRAKPLLRPQGGAGAPRCAQGAGAAPRRARGLPGWAEPTGSRAAPGAGSVRAGLRLGVCACAPAGARRLSALLEYVVGGGGRACWPSWAGHGARAVAGRALGGRGAAGGGPAGRVWACEGPGGSPDKQMAGLCAGSPGWSRVRAGWTCPRGRLGGWRLARLTRGG